MKHQSKFTSSEQQQQQASVHETQQHSGRDFETVEELLRCDAGQTKVPSEIAERLQQSIAAESAAPRRSWWRRFLGENTP